MGGAPDLAPAYAAAGFRMQDVIPYAGQESDMLLCLPDPHAKNPIVWEGALLALAKQQAKRAWLEGCLLGVYLAGQSTTTMASGALQTAKKKVNAQIMDASARRQAAELMSLEEMLSAIDLEPGATLETAVEAAVGFARPLTEFGLSPLDMASCAQTLVALWVNALAVGREAGKDREGEVVRKHLA